MNPLYFLFLAGYFAIRLYNFPYVMNRSVVADDTPWYDTILSVGIYLGIVVVPLMIATYPQTMLFWQVPYDFTVAGFVLCSASLLILYYAHRELLSNYAGNLKIYGNHRLVTTGIYRYIPHPMYLAVGLFVAGAFCFTGSFLVSLSGLAYALMMVTRIPKEDAMLYDAFGLDWVQYRSNTLF